MTGRIEKDLIFLNEPTGEGLRFAKLFLGDETLAQELVERALLRLTIVRDGKRSRAKFFGDLENLCLEEKNKKSSLKEKQLELFTIEPSGQVRNENKKDIKRKRLVYQSLQSPYRACIKSYMNPTWVGVHYIQVWI